MSENMNNNEAGEIKMPVKLSEYEKSTHRVGKITSAMALFIMLGVPVAICIYFNVAPPWNSFWKGLLGVVALFLPVGVIEFITYAPMVGPGSSYLMFVTGNLTNLKIPCAVNAMRLADVKSGSEEGEIISTISIAVSAIVTDIIIIIGVVGLSFIRPLLEAPLMQPAFDNVLPALFGALGIIWLRKYYKIAIVPAIVMLVVFIFAPTSIVGVLVPVGALIAIFCAKYLYKRGKI
jgi:hypothetical protein